jgi:hypothetical protein
MISKETATDIALAYRELETAEKLAADVREAMDRFTGKDIRDAFGRRQDGLQLGVPSGQSGHQLFNVPYSLAGPIIDTHIAHHRSRLVVLSEKARIELGMLPAGDQLRSEGA